MIKKNPKKMCLNHLVQDLLGFDDEMCKQLRETVSILIDKGYIRLDKNWKIDKQDTWEVLAKIIFNDKDLLSKIRNKYWEFSEKYHEFERRYHEYIKTPEGPAIWHDPEPPKDYISTPIDSKAFLDFLRGEKDGKRHK